MSVERGLVEGQLDAWLGVWIWRTDELQPYHTVFGQTDPKTGSAMSMSVALMNLERWNSFPPDIQEVIMDAGSVLEEDATALVEAKRLAEEYKKP